MRLLERILYLRIALAWRWAVLRRWVIGDLCAGIIQCVARIPALRWVPRRLMVPIEAALIDAWGERLFDPDFYRLQNPDVARQDVDPHRHYLRHGWREGRAPNALFDDGYYRAESGLSARTPVSPLAHFIAFGQKGGLCPVPGIDLAAISGSQPGLSVVRQDPYHQLIGGTAPQRAAELPGLDRLQADLADATPQVGDWDVDVIIPVYLGRVETLNTIAHVLRARTDLRLHLVVIDDASPDAALSADLRALADRGVITLIRHKRNQGFVVAVNRGLSVSQRDVIWLNADTEVYDGWADRLHVAAYSAGRVATVTPLTNNGTICSYPRTNADNPGELEVAWPDLDAITADVNHGVCIEAPTAVGFCTYVRRAALRAIGPLDAGAFGHGYGEENDFSQRAQAAGWANLIAANVMVRHFGSTSFRGSRAQRVETALKVLEARHPGYRDDVQAFLGADPLHDARAALDIARLQRLTRSRNVLIVTHSLGGGTQQHVQEEIARMSARGMAVFLLQGGTGGGETAMLSAPGAAALPALAGLALDGNRLWDTLAALKIDEIHIHHLIDFDARAPEVLLRRADELGRPIDMMVHDYYPVCPRINLVDNAGLYCGEPGLAGCQTCLRRRGARVGRVDISAWRFGYERLLCAAREVRVPDVDVARRLRRYFPRLDRIAVRPHEPPALARHRPVRPRRPGPLRVAIPGAIGPTKGFDAILGLARHAEWQGLPLRLTIIGYTRNDAAAHAAGIEVTGAYSNDQIDDLITNADPDVVWIPSLWPETYSYTLSIALRSGRAVAAFDIGALGTRLRAAGRGTLIPIEQARDPSAIYDALCDAAGLRQDLKAPA